MLWKQFRGQEKKYWMNSLEPTKLIQQEIHKEAGLIWIELDLRHGDVLQEFAVSLEVQKIQRRIDNFQILGRWIVDTQSAEIPGKNCSNMWTSWKVGDLLTQEPLIIDRK